MQLSDGWWRVVLRNNKPAEDEVDTYSEWVERFDGVWQLDNYLDNHEVVEVLHKENLRSRQCQSI